MTDNISTHLLQTKDSDPRVVHGIDKDILAGVQHLTRPSGADKIDTDKGIYKVWIGVQVYKVHNCHTPEQALAACKEDLARREDKAETASAAQFDGDKTELAYKTELSSESHATEGSGGGRKSCRKLTRNLLAARLHKLGVTTYGTGPKCDTKRIPWLYLTANSSNCTAVLTGLLDSDGCLKRTRGMYGFMQCIDAHEQLFYDTVFAALANGHSVEVESLHAKTSKSKIKGVWQNIVGSPSLVATISHRIERLPVVIPYKQAKQKPKLHERELLTRPILQVEAEDDKAIVVNLMLESPKAYKLLWHDLLFLNIASPKKNNKVSDSDTPKMCEHPASLNYAARQDAKRAAC